jgi:hypothetical protein
MSLLDNATEDEWTKAAQGALKKQVGGSHYNEMKIQPIEFILANELGFCEGNIIKYICRYAKKGGAQDLDKVIHYVELLQEVTYGEGIAQNNTGV